MFVMCSMHSYRRCNEGAGTSYVVHHDVMYPEIGNEEVRYVSIHTTKGLSTHVQIYEKIP